MRLVITGGPLRLHPRPPAADAAGAGGPRAARRGGGPAGHPQRLPDAHGARDQLALRLRGGLRETLPAPVSRVLQGERVLSASELGEDLC